MNSIEPGIRAITDVDYGWCSFSCISIDTPEDYSFL